MAVVLVFLGHLLVMGKLLYSQDIPVVAGLLGVVLLLLTAQVTCCIASMPV